MLFPSIRASNTARCSTVSVSNRLGSIAIRLGKVSNRLGKVSNRLGKVSNRLGSTDVNGCISINAEASSCVLNNLNTAPGNSFTCSFADDQSS